MNVVHMKIVVVQQLQLGEIVHVVGKVHLEIDAVLLQIVVLLLHVLIMLNGIHQKLALVGKCYFVVLVVQYVHQVLVIVILIVMIMNMNVPVVNRVL